VTHHRKDIPLDACQGEEVEESNTPVHNGEILEHVWGGGEVGVQLCRRYASSRRYIPELTKLKRMIQKHHQT
jgi:hypothetical protein